MKLGNFGKIGIGWTLAITGSFVAFYFSKTTIDDRRQQSMQARQRMLKANTGDYQPSERRFD